MIITNTNLAMIRGDSESLTVKCVDQDGAALDFAVGDTVYLTVKDSLGDSAKILQKTVTSFTNGAAIFTIDPADTQDLYFKTYVYDIQWNRNDGSVKTIVPPAQFTIMQEVTYE